MSTLTKDWTTNTLLPAAPHGRRGTADACVDPMSRWQWLFTPAKEIKSERTLSTFLVPTLFLARAASLWVDVAEDWKLAELCRPSAEVAFTVGLGIMAHAIGLESACPMTGREKLAWCAGLASHAGLAPAFAFVAITWQGVLVACTLLSAYLLGFFVFLLAWPYTLSPFACFAFCGLSLTLRCL